MDPALQKPKGIMAGMAHEAEREAFKQLKSRMEKDPELKNQVEKALSALLTRFSTKPYENRFVVGGAVEVIMVAALRAAGVDAADVGTEQGRIDIRLPGGGLSVKGRFQDNNSIRLINVLGESEQTEWQEATLFVLHGVGIGYADPELLKRYDAVEREKDAWVMRYSVLLEFLNENPEWLIACEVPRSLEDPSKSDLVSRELARQILSEHAPRLAKALR